MFFNKFLHSGWWNRTFFLVEIVFVSSEFFLCAKTVTEFNRSQFLKKDHILVNENRFLGWWKPFIPFRQQSQFSKKELVFCLVEKVFFFGQCYFAASRNRYWNKKETVLRERLHSCQWTIDFLTIEKHFFSPFFGDNCQFFTV